MRTPFGFAVRLALHPVALLLVSLAGIGFAYAADNAIEPLPFDVAIAATIIGIIFALSARLAFSVYLGWGIVVVLTLISAIKYKMKGFSLHFYDGYFFGADIETYRFLVQSYFYLIVPVVLGLALLGALGVALYRADRRVPWSIGLRAVPIAVSVAMLPLTYPKEAQSGATTYYIQGRHVSAAFVSLKDIGNLFAPNEFERRISKFQRNAATDNQINCGEATARPDVFIILSESTVDPAIFPQIESGQGFLQRHAPSTGTPHPMRVENFGGGTWISNLSMQAGLSSTDFGWRRPYLTMTLEGKVGGSLPQSLAACGYRTAALLPLQEGFVNEGAFLRSIGYETVMDKDVIGATNYHMRDNFYYQAAERFIAEHRAKDGRPLLLFIETMFPHSPYNERLEPEIEVAGEPLSDDPDVAEYLRRIAIARQDLQEFMDSRKTAPTDRGSVVLEYGDHQSIATQSLVEMMEGEGAVGDLDSLAYQTYYTVSAFNFRMKTAMPAMPLDIPFVGAALLEAAGLPTSIAMLDLNRLRDQCQGLFRTCNDRVAVDQYLASRFNTEAIAASSDKATRELANARPISKAVDDTIR